MDIKGFEWVEFYKELADYLLSYKDDHKKMISDVLNMFSEINIEHSKLDSGDEIVDMDPFTVYGMFNKGITNEKRKRICEGFSKLFSMKSKAPTEFDGIPVLNNLNATFYRFSDDPKRGKFDIEYLWNCFEYALKCADNSSEENRKNFIEAYNNANSLGGNKFKITMGLYWIRPENYLNLDSRNRWFLIQEGKISPETAEEIKKIRDVPNGESYLSLCEKIRGEIGKGSYTYKSLPELSREAWLYSEEVNQERKAEKEQLQQNEKGAAMADQDIETKHYWLYSPGESARIWEECYAKGIMAIGWDEIGNLTQYASKTEMKQAMKKCIEPEKAYTMAAHATWQFANEIKPGDIVFAKKGMHLIVGRGVVESGYEYDESRNENKNVRRVNWTHKGEWQHPGQAAMKTLTDITAFKDYIEELNALFESEEIDDIETDEVSYPPYSSEQFLEDVYMPESDYRTLVALVKNKKNVILQGAPGVGKTYAAKRLAYSIMGVKDPNRVLMVQFHQSYSYEDLIMGFRPSGSGFELKRGAFYNFCKAAEVDSDNDYFFIIDEINRGNISRIFGELFMLIENDKRGVELQLLYSDEKFSVPSNVYIIGMMNTADRSLAMLDYALRRRFAFFEMKPGFETEGFRKYRMNLESTQFDNLINCVENLNNAIATDESLGEGFSIGHSYFCNLDEITDQALSGIVEFELIPLLKEYWFDEPVKVKDWSANLRSAIK